MSRASNRLDSPVCQRPSLRPRRHREPRALADRLRLVPDAVTRCLRGDIALHRGSGGVAAPGDDGRALLGAEAVSATCSNGWHRRSYDTPGTGCVCGLYSNLLLHEKSAVCGAVFEAPPVRDKKAKAPKEYQVWLRSVWLNRPQCYWCGRETILVKRSQRPSRLPFNHATVDHIRRGEVPGKKKVLACSSCNGRRENAPKDHPLYLNPLGK